MYASKSRSSFGLVDLKQNYAEHSSLLSISFKLLTVLWVEIFDSYTDY